jgi:hypothetical protein
MQSSSTTMVAAAPPIVLNSELADLTRENIEKFFTLVSQIVAGQHGVAKELGKKIQSGYIKYLRLLNTESYISGGQSRVLCSRIDLFALQNPQLGLDVAIFEKICYDISYAKKLASLHFESPDELSAFIDSLIEIQTEALHPPLKTQLIIPARVREMTHLANQYISPERALEIILLEASLTRYPWDAITLYQQAQAITQASMHPLELQNYTTTIQHHLALAYLLHARSLTPGSPLAEDYFRLASTESEALTHDPDNIWLCTQIELAFISYRQGQKIIASNIPDALIYFKAAKDRIDNIFIRLPHEKAKFAYYQIAIVADIMKLLTNKLNPLTSKYSETLLLSREISAYIESLSDHCNNYLASTYQSMQKTISIYLIKSLSEIPNLALCPTTKINRLKEAIDVSDKINFNDNQELRIRHQHYFLNTLLEFIESIRTELHPQQLSELMVYIQAIINKIPADQLTPTHLSNYSNTIKNFIHQIYLTISAIDSSQTAPPSNIKTIHKYYQIIIGLIKLIPNTHLLPEETLHLSWYYQAALICTIRRILNAPEPRARKNINYLLKTIAELSPQIIVSDPTNIVLENNQHLIARLLFEYAELIRHPQIRLSILTHSRSIIEKICLSNITEIDQQNHSFLNKLILHAETECIIDAAEPIKNNIEQSEQIAKMLNREQAMKSVNYPGYEYYERFLLNLLDRKREKIIQFHQNCLDGLIKKLGKRLLSRPYFFSQRNRQVAHNVELRKIYREDIEPLKFEKSEENYLEAELSIKIYFDRRPKSREPLMEDILNKIYLLNYFRDVHFTDTLTPPGPQAIPRPRP